jgi:Flp pilus assembly protein TadD
LPDTPKKGKLQLLPAVRSLNQILALIVFALVGTLVTQAVAPEFEPMEFFRELFQPKEKIAAPTPERPAPDFRRVSALAEEEKEKGAEAQNLAPAPSPSAKPVENSTEREEETVIPGATEERGILNDNKEENSSPSQGEARRGFAEDSETNAVSLRQEPSPDPSLEGRGNSPAPDLNPSKIQHPKSKIQAPSILFPKGESVGEIPAPPAFLQPESEPEPELSFRQLLEEGEKAIKNRDTGAAIVFFERAMELEPQAPEPDLGVARAFLHDGEFSLAVENARKASAKNPFSLEAKELLCRAYLSSENWESARNTLLGLENPDSEPAFLLAVSQIFLNDRVRAGDLLHRVYGLQEDFPSAEHAAWAEKAKRVIEAYHEWDEFRDSSPPHLKALLAKGLLDSGEPWLARAAAKNLLTEEPEYRDVWLIRGYSELQLGRAEEATNSFKQVKELDPTHPAGAFYLGVALAEAGDFEKAGAELARARSLGWPESLGLAEWEEWLAGK